MITKLEEKRGSRTKLDNESIHLKNFIQNNWLIDMPFNNGIYTWNNKREGTHQIASRLDRFFFPTMQSILEEASRPRSYFSQAQITGQYHSNGKDWATLHNGLSTLKRSGLHIQTLTI